jgi:hypothetical protein
MHNPLRSEADAFRFVVVIGSGAAAVIALTLLTRPVFGVVLAATLIGFAAGSIWRGFRTNLDEADVAEEGDDSAERAG